LLWIESQWGEVWNQESLWSYILGFYPRYWPSLDYFPLEPWLASISGGALIASLIFEKAERRYPFFNLPKFLQPVIWVGQKALWIYLLHIPVFAALIWALDKIGVY